MGPTNQTPSGSNSKTLHTTQSTTSPLLLPEALGFVPQLLLDDIINIANEAVTVGVNGMETFLCKWAEDRTRRLAEESKDSNQSEEWDSIQEIEQGLVAFQTLLNYHTDIALDFFEAWSLRNIFAIPPNLPIVLPHQKGLDLTVNPDEEKKLMEELDEIREQIMIQRYLNRHVQRALSIASLKRRRAQENYNHLSNLLTPSHLSTFTQLAPQFLVMHKQISSLPAAINPEETAEEEAKALTQLKMQLTDPGKRMWETSRAGYVNWAVGQLKSRISDANNGGGYAEGLGSIPELEKMASSTAKVQTLKKMPQAFGDGKE